MTMLSLDRVCRFHLPLKLTVGVSVVAWLVAWFTEAPLADWLSFKVFGLERGSHFGEAIAFFLLDVPKVPNGRDAFSSGPCTASRGVPHRGRMPTSHCNIRAGP